MCTQPAVDRSPFRKLGLSPAPLQQAVKSLAPEEIKRRPSRRANRGWEGPPTQAMAKEEGVNGYPSPGSKGVCHAQRGGGVPEEVPPHPCPHCHSAMALSPQHAWGT